MTTTTSKRRRNSVRLKRFRDELFKTQKECFFCGDALIKPKIQPNRAIPPNYPTLEHLTPRSRGGTDAPNNLVLSCYNCNSRQIGLVLAMFRESDLGNVI